MRGDVTWRSLDLSINTHCWPTCFGLVEHRRCHGVGLKLHLAMHPMLPYGRGSVTVTGPIQFTKLLLSSTGAYDGLFRWQVRSLHVAT